MRPWVHILSVHLLFSYLINSEFCCNCIGCLNVVLCLSHIHTHTHYDTYIHTHTMYVYVCMCHNVCVYVCEKDIKTTFKQPMQLQQYVCHTYCQTYQ